MKRAHTTVAVFAALALPAVAQEVAPIQVEWVDEVTIPQSLSGVPGDVENGKVLMNKGAGNCIACHAVTELAHLQWHGEIGPSLDGVADRWTEAELREIVADAKRMFPESMMPSFYKTEGFIRPGNAYTGKPAEGELEPLLTAQEIEDVVAYLMTLNYTN